MQKHKILDFSIIKIKLKIHTHINTNDKKKYIPKVLKPACAWKMHTCSKNKRPKIKL